MAEAQMESDRCEIEEQGDEVAENSHNWKQFRWCCTFAQFFASLKELKPKWDQTDIKLKRATKWDEIAILGPKHGKNHFDSNP